MQLCHFEAQLLFVLHILYCIVTRSEPRTYALFTMPSVKVGKSSCRDARLLVTDRKLSDV